MRIIFSILVMLLSQALPSQGFANPLRVKGNQFENRMGDQIILRGVNVSGASKVPPFRAIRGPEDFQPLRGWGFNTVRLLFNWEAFESVKDRYDESYLTYYLNTVRWAESKGLYVIVDVHQDAFSRFSIGGCGEGFPQWALPPEQIALEPRNDDSCEAWFLNAVADIEMHSAWHHFYANTWGLRDKYLKMIDRLTLAIAREPNVIGVDLINEPWGDEESELYQLYIDAARVVRKNMPETILFLSPVAVTSLGLKASTLPKIPGRNIVHSTHFYDPELLAGSWSQWALDQSALSWKTIGETWRTPVFLGEFGARPDVKNAREYVNNIYAHLDANLYSGAIWVYTPTWNFETKDGWNREDLSIADGEGKLRAVYQPRPFVEKTPGDLKAMKWDLATMVLSFSYKPKFFSRYFEVIIPSDMRVIDLDAAGRSIFCKNKAGNRLRCRVSRSLVHFTTDIKIQFAAVNAQ